MQVCKYQMRFLNHLSLGLCYGECHLQTQAYIHPSNKNGSSVKWILQLLKLFYHNCGLPLLSLCY